MPPEAAAKQIARPAPDSSAMDAGCHNVPENSKYSGSSPLPNPKPRDQPLETELLRDHKRKSAVGQEIPFDPDRQIIAQRCRHLASPLEDFLAAARRAPAL